MAGARRITGQAGFSKLELVVVAIVFGVLASVLLNRLAYYQEAAEKARVEYTIGAMKNALRHRTAELLIAGRSQEYRFLAGGNPMEWLDPKPDNYLGPLSGRQPSDVPSGSWYFDTAARELIYVPNNAAYFQGDAEGRKWIRLRIAPTPNFLPAAGERGEGPRPTDGVGLEFVQPYSWF